MPPTGQPRIDYSKISDDELSTMLRDYGVDVGPITETTRSTYERKLFKLKTGSPLPASQSYEPADDDDDDEDDTEVQFRRTETRTAYTPSPMSEHYQPRMRHEVQDYTPMSRIESRPPLSSARGTTSQTYRRASPPTKPTPESKGVPLWVKLMALAVIVVLVFLIYSNMESQATSNIPSLSNKMEV